MGGTGGRYSGPRSDDLLERINKAREKERERLDGQVNDLIRELLARYNDRDTEKVSERLDDIRERLDDVAEIDSMFFGGSVAKHTAVDGLSDVDALVVLDREKIGADSPQDLIDSFHRLLYQSLPRSEVESIRKGRLAVTVTYQDGQEIQLLPALRSRQDVRIASSDGSAWQNTKPRAFERALTDSNRKMNGSLVPTIKLVKSVVSDLPPQKQLKGYHVETLAVDAARGYTGPKTPRALLLHTLEHSSRRVLRPIADVTGQSRVADGYLGPENSVQRRNVSQTLAGIKRRLEAATTVAQWRAVLDRVRD
jgi:hypothetical protein